MAQISKKNSIVGSLNTPDSVLEKLLNQAQIKITDKYDQSTDAQNGED